MAAEAFSWRVTRQLGRWLGHWGVDAEQYHWLLQASLRMDFRSRSALQGTQGSNRTRSALITTSAINFLFSLVMAGSLRISGVGTFFFSAIMFGYSMTMMAMSILLEFGLVVISPDDFLILAHRPVSSRTFFAVKCSNLLFYTLLMDLSLNLAPALVGWTFGDAPWHFPLVYLAIALLTGVFVAAVVATLYGLLLQHINYERFKDLLTWCQIVFSFVFFFGYQMIPRLLGQVHEFRLENTSPIVAGLLPPVWFAALTELGLGHFSWFAVALSSLVLVMTTLLLPGLLRSVSLDYSDRIGGMVSAAINRRSRSRHRQDRPSLPWTERLLIFDQEERALFGFLLKMLRRNRQLKMQLYPNFGIVIALFALGVMEHEKMGDPLAGGQMSFMTAFPLMAFLFGTMGFTASLPFSDEHQGGWIFHVAPIARPERFLKAIKKAIFLVLFVPLFLLNVLLFSFLWPVTHALAISLYGLAMGLVALQASLFLFRVFPFTLKPAKGTQSQRMTLVFMMMIAYAIFMMLPALFNSVPGLLPVIVILFFVLALALGRLNNRAYTRAIHQLEFEAD